jgi:hypothetical protein
VLRFGGELPFEFHHQIRQLADIQTEIGCVNSDRLARGCDYSVSASVGMVNMPTGDPPGAFIEVFDRSRGCSRHATDGNDGHAGG